MGQGEELQSTPTPTEVVEITADKLQHADAALNFLETHETVTYTKAEERAVLRKIDWRLMPLMTISYMIQFMDKSVMAQSAIYELETTLNLTGQDYSWCSSIFYFGYLAFQPAAARLLNYVPLGQFVPATSLVWAIILFSTAGATNFTGMMVLRFFLGMAEAGISPAYVLVTGKWYKKDEIPMRTCIWYCGDGLAEIIQGLIAYGIGHIATGIPPWRWFFIIYGMIGLVWAGVLWVLMPDTPLTAKFLDEREKSIAVERLRENRTGITNTEFKKDQFIEAITDVKVWYGFFYTMAGVIPTTAVVNFGTLIIKGFGYSSFVTSLLSIPLGGMLIISVLTCGLITTYVPNMRCMLQVMCNIPAVIGSACVYALPKEKKVGRLIAFYCTNLTNGTLPLTWALILSNIGGQTKRATTNAILFVAYSLGFIIGPQFFIGSEAPSYPTGYETVVITFAISMIAPIFFWSYITWENRRRSKKLAETGQGQVYVRNEEFLELTDKQQAHFVYIK